MKAYTTISGDTFDSIAYKEYGSCDYADRIMTANIGKIDYLVFPAGIVLNLPTETELADEIAVASDAPAWRSE
jgi:phage tail protein X